MNDSDQTIKPGISDQQPSPERASDGSNESAGLSFDIDEQPVVSSGTQLLTERTDLPISGLPRPETRKIPLWGRVRLAWHRQILRDAG
jgi:hypothetical protein